MVAVPDKKLRCPEKNSLHFRIGDIDISVRSDLDEVLEDYAALYRQYGQVDGRQDRAIRMEVKAGGRTLLGRRRYVICGDGKEMFANRRPEEVLPYLEWGINWRVIATRTEHLQLHAAAMARDGQGVVFSGASGLGKSTLAAGLLARGWSYLSDEFALIDPGTLCIHPFPKALCIKSGSFGIVRDLDLLLYQRRHYYKAFKGRVGFVNPAEVNGPLPPSPSPIRFVIFIKYLAGAEPRLYPISRSQAAFRLAASSFNRSVFGHRAVSILNRVVRGAECFGLEAGPIGASCDLVESLLSNPAIGDQRSAMH